jgi:hypothetical protein
MKLTFVSCATVAAVLGALLVTFTFQGCGSNCADGCPATTVWIGSPDASQLLIKQINVNGPACPAPATVHCYGNYNATCSDFTLAARAVGRCDVEVVFGDGRPSQVVHLEFGPTQKGGGSCCQGYPVIGSSIYAIPDTPDGGGEIYSTGEGGVMNYDAISIVPDASVDVATDASD